MQAEIIERVDFAHLNKVATQVRRDIIRMVHCRASGHPGGSLGCADYFVLLYFALLSHNKKFTMKGHNEDLFFLSNGHISPVWYSVLARSGYFEVSELATFRNLNSRLLGHPATIEHLPGIRAASGSLGQGMSIAIGAALAKKMNKDNKLVYVLMGDGEQQEGQVWEAAMFAAHKQVDNLIATIDYNGQQIDGPVDKVLSLLDLSAKYRAFGWEVIETPHGNDLEKLHGVFINAISKTGNKKPVIVIMKTEMGFGIDYMMGTHKWHGTAPNDAQLKAGLLQLEETLGDY